MKEKYELKTTVGQIAVDAEFMKGAPNQMPVTTNVGEQLALFHDARLAHELLERVAFLERVAEQMVRCTYDMQIEGEELVLVDADYQKEVGRIRLSEIPELDQYLREREVAE